MRRRRWALSGGIALAGIGLVPIVGGTAAYAAAPGATVRGSEAAGPADANGESTAPSMSGSGRFVAYASSATNLVPGDANGKIDIFVTDRDSDANGTFDEPGTVTTALVSVDDAGVQSNGNSFTPAISPNGRYVAFQSWGSNLVGGDLNGQPDIFVRDRDADMDGIYDETGPGESTTVRVSVDSLGVEANGPSTTPSVSDVGSVAFASSATNLVADDTNAFI